MHQMREFSDVIEAVSTDLFTLQFVRSVAFFSLLSKKDWSIHTYKSLGKIK